MGSTKPTIKIDITSDTMCPWCFVGKRHLETAMKDFESTFEFDIEWKPFLLNSNTPEEGIPVLEYLAQRYGQQVADDARNGTSSLIAAGRKVGLNFDSNRKFVNSIRSHCLLDYARTEKKQNQLAELLFQRYFIDGNNINDVKVLLDCAKEIGLKAEEAKKSLQDKERRKKIIEEAKVATQNQIHGVPHFVISLIGDQHGKAMPLHGCQPIEMFRRVFTSIKGRMI
ncbi:Uncharacterized protein YwbO [Trichoplax sp. H2]|uniref:DSBA-like thioredoxin domain-containing protein n=1 Tax=Trichoplax adhaerens TaxID=10228 RepID=B3SBG0_TRIAD|nr:hypothetical protein TRIADDRAFT_61605 [Trichoplax adhaerens]EDV19951.1 hypothetical protein TRIADDRAFT_61605 [Trichoplax adhaerens]RDD37565.1 Uncharacterized protein YwbO [Trichoplax sp. H2]|eukprot:XP_002117541.1 hypothetical protein TRIADDRAFT_61605 [Trichoplax adhaerens]